MVGHGGSSAGSYLADPTSPIPSHCVAIILFQSVPVHQLSLLALQELKKWDQVLKEIDFDRVYKPVSPLQRRQSNQKVSSLDASAFRCSFVSNIILILQTCSRLPWYEQLFAKLGKLHILSSSGESVRYQYTNTVIKRKAGTCWTNTVIKRKAGTYWTNTVIKWKAGTYWTNTVIVWRAGTYWTNTVTVWKAGTYWTNTVIVWILDQYSDCVESWYILWKAGTYWTNTVIAWILDQYSDRAESWYILDQHSDHVESWYIVGIEL